VPRRRSHRANQGTYSKGHLSLTTCRMSFSTSPRSPLAHPTRLKRPEPGRSLAGANLARVDYYSENTGFHCTVRHLLQYLSHVREERTRNVGMFQGAEKASRLLFLASRQDQKRERGTAAVAGCHSARGGFCKGT
jgi:hypothetical protein